MFKSTIFILLILFILICGCGGKKTVLFSGKTMGTTWHVKVVPGYLAKIENLEAKIKKRLQQINRSMSTFDKNSEISRFNEMVRPFENFYISDDFLSVMLVAEELYVATDGSWDGTVNPLVDVWGFGKARENVEMPDKEEIRLVMRDIGFHGIEISEKGYIVKKNPSITLNLASIAKGYAVDQVAELIEKNGIKNFLVEIGGEVYASGVREDGEKWRIGVNTPLKDAPHDQVYKVVALQNKAFATSGDYRNFFEIDGKRYSHVIDPLTGYPVSNGVVSVSVAADNCTFADGLATALMVMGKEKGVELTNRLENAECLIVVAEDDGVLRDYASKGFQTDM